MNQWHGSLPVGHGGSIPTQGGGGLRLHLAVRTAPLEAHHVCDQYSMMPHFGIVLYLVCCMWTAST